MAASDSGRTLFDENKIGDLTLKNRVVLAPLTRSKAGVERVPNALMAEYYQQRAGAGLVITEATTVSPQGNGYVNTPGIYTEEQSQAWRPIVDAVHSEGGLIFLQLWHTGRASHSDFHNGELPVSASAIKIEGDGIHTPLGKKEFETPRPLETDEIPGVVADYNSAAKLAKAAGFDGVEIHSANGYLLDQFLQSSSNQRTDDYGGSVENRFRLLREVVATVTEVFDANRVGLRLSPNGMFNGMGAPDFRETFLYAAQELNKFGLGYLHVMDGLAFGFHEQGEPITLDDIKEVYSGVVMGNCGYNQETAEAAVKAGSADLIAFGRPYITNPDLVERFRNQWPLTPDSDPTTWYTTENPAEGYTSYANYEAVDA